MARIDKIILVFVVVQVTLVLAKPRDPERDERLNHSDDDMEDFHYKRESTGIIITCLSNRLVTLLSMR